MTVFRWYLDVTNNAIRKETDVRQSMARVAASPYIPHKDQVRGFVYDVKTGRLNEVEN